MFIARLIADEDVRNETGIQSEYLIGALAKIVKEVQEKLGARRIFQPMTKESSKTVMEVGILRYPDFEHPFFKVTYRNLIRGILFISCIQAIPYQVGYSRLRLPERGVGEGLACWH